MTDEGIPTNVSQPVTASVPNAGFPPTDPAVDQWSAPPPPLEMPPIASIVAPGSQTDTPKWFLVIFALTLAAFFSIATLIALSFWEQSKRSSSQSLADQQEGNSQVPEPSVSPVIQLTPTPTETPDSLESLEFDINRIDLSDVEKELKNVE